MTTVEIMKAAAILNAGGLVAFPTETVYGLGADASNELAVRNIFRAKERPFDHPLIVHIAHLSQLPDWAMDISPQAMQLAETFWPGPLTIILKKQPHVLDAVTGAQKTIGLRIPNHPVALALLQAFGKGVAAPSANKFTHISPTTAAAVQAELGAKVDLILDGGACAVGLESTIVDMSGDQPIILRPGMISAQMLEDVLVQPIQMVRQDTPSTRAPGMHHLHYAPTTKTILIPSQRIAGFMRALSANDLPLALLLHTKHALPAIDGVHVVNMPNNADDYAHDLYQTLRMLDNHQFKRIMIEAVPLTPEWEAIRDRLEKATAAR